VTGRVAPRLLLVVASTASLLTGACLSGRAGQPRDAQSTPPDDDQVRAMLSTGISRELLANMKKLQTPDALPGLARVLRDPGQKLFVRNNAARVLGRIGTRPAREVLIPVLETAEKPMLNPMGSLWSTALNAVGDCIGRESEKELLEDLRHANPYVRWLAAMQLGKRKAKAAVPALIRLLDDEHHDPRLGATWALGEIQDPRGIEQLIAIVEMRRPGGNRISAIEAMGKIASARCIQAIQAVKPDDREYWIAAKAMKAALDRGAVLKPFLGVPHDQELKHQEGVIRGITKMTAVEATTPEHYRWRKRRGEVTAEECHGDWLYLAIEDGLDVPFQNASAWAIVTRRYKVLLDANAHGTLNAAFASLVRSAIAVPTRESRMGKAEQNPTVLDFSTILRWSGQRKDVDAFTSDHRFYERDANRLIAARKTWALCALLDHSNADAKIHAARCLLALADPGSVPALLAAAKANNYAVSGSENATIHAIYRRTLKQGLERITGLGLTPGGLKITSYPKPGKPKVVRSEDAPHLFKEEVDFAKVEDWLRKRFLAAEAPAKP